MTAPRSIETMVNDATRGMLIARRIGIFKGLALRIDRAQVAASFPCSSAASFSRSGSAFTGGSAAFTGGSAAFTGGSAAFAGGSAAFAGAPGDRARRQGFRPNWPGVGQVPALDRAAATVLAGDQPTRRVRRRGRALGIGQARRLSRG